VSIKTSMESWAHRTPSRAIALIAAVGIVLGGLLGAATGFKIEQGRTRADVKRLKAEIARQQTGASKGRHGTRVAASPTLSPVERVGTLTATSTSLLTVRTQHRGIQRLHVAAATRFEQSLAGSAKNIAVGRRVLLSFNGADMIVLPNTSTLGRTVTRVNNREFTLAPIPYAKRSARPATILLSTVLSVEQAAPANVSDAKVGNDVIAAGHPTASGFTATEVILLPHNSPFAQ